MNKCANIIKRSIQEEVSDVIQMKPSKYLEAILESCEVDLVKGEKLSPLFTDTAEMDRYLDRL